MNNKFLNYITDIKINKNGVPTLLESPSTNGRVKFVNGKPVLKQTIPLTKVSDLLYTANISGEYILYGIVNFGNAIPSSDPTEDDPVDDPDPIADNRYLFSISINNNIIYTMNIHPSFEKDYIVVCPVNGTGTLKITYNGTIMYTDRLLLWTFL